MMTTAKEVIVILDRWIGFAARVAMVGCVSAGLLSIGCANRRARGDVDEEALILRRDQYVAAAQESYDQATLRLVHMLKAKLDAYNEGRTAQPPVFNVLILSGGGEFGAFGAGFLQGWGTINDPQWKRPQFDVVGGVSTGALIAPFAFLGDDASYERALKLYREPSDDWFRRRGLLFFLPFRESLVRIDGFKRDVQSEFDPVSVQRIAAEAEKGRLLAIGTTNLDFRMQRTWDLGDQARAMAESGSNERLVDILLASAAIPGAFPAVEIDGYLYADGAVAANILYDDSMRSSRGLTSVWAREYPGVSMPLMRYWVIINGKLEPPPRLVQPTWVSVTAASINVIIRSNTTTALQNLASQLELINLSGMATKELRYVYVPDSWRPAVAGQFQKENMQSLSDLGLRMGADPSSWQSGGLAPAQTEIDPQASTDVRSASRIINRRLWVVKHDLCNLICEYCQPQPAAAFQVGEDDNGELSVGKQPKVRSKALLHSPMPDRAVGFPAFALADVPAQSVSRFPSVAGLLVDGHLLESLGLEQYAALHCNGKPRQILGGRDQTAAGDLIARIHQCGIAPVTVELTVHSRRIASRAIRDDDVNVVNLRVHHPCWLKNMLPQIFGKRHSRCAFDYRPKQCVSVGRVRVLRSGIMFERVVFENTERVAQVRIMDRALAFAAIVSANSTQMRQHLPRRDREWFGRKTRNIFLDRRVEVELSRFHELHRRDRRQRFRNRCDPIDCRSLRGYQILQIGQSIAAIESNLIILDDRDGRRGNVDPRHEVPNSRFDFRDRLGRQLGVSMRRRGCPRRNHQNNRCTEPPNLCMCSWSFHASLLSFVKFPAFDDIHNAGCVSDVRTRIGAQDDQVGDLSRGDRSKVL